MNFGEIKTLFVDMSGRHDLSDARVGWLINQGQRMLDRLQDTPHSLAWYKKDLNEGNYLIKLQRVLSVEEVYIVDSDGRTRLKRRDFKTLLLKYGEDFGSVEEGSSKYWSPAVFLLAPSQHALSSPDFTYDQGGVLYESNEDYNAILIMPPTDSVVTISVLAKWYQPELVKESDSSYWSAIHPEVLTLAAMYQLEQFYRNREGMADYMAAIKEQLFEIENRLVESEVNHINQMRG